MAKNVRDPVKWVRDRAKRAYEKASECYICGSSSELELHHYNSLTHLLEKWLGGKNVTDEEIVDLRDQFIEAHHSEIYKEVVTLCLKHHQRLHAIYGVKPLPSTASKQSAWVEIQRNKIRGTPGTTAGEAKPSTETDS